MKHKSEQRRSGKHKSEQCHIGKLQGSLSLEAAMSLPLFLLAVTALLSFLVILNLQVNIQASMEQASRSMGKKAYLLQQAAQGLSDDTSGAGGAGTGASASAGTLSSKGVDREAQGLMSAGINSLTIKAFVLSANGLSGKLDSSRILGGAGGLYTYESSFDQSSGILDMITSYDYSVPWLPGRFSKVRLVQRMRSHVWTGTSLTDTSGGSDGQETGKVYVTPTGSVYHLYPDCHYLDLSIHSVFRSEVDSRRNAGGEKYDPCEECARNSGSDQVYITDYGTSWHSSLTCSGLKRTVEEKELADVEGMRVCTKCQQEHLHSH
ncbi:MAG: pilus assembly protein [Parasporobacterium sp.]|nr:pilus assembly protein [Parasporobacterium sp.]